MIRMDARAWRDVLAMRRLAAVHGVGHGTTADRSPADAPPLIRDVYLPLIARIARAPLTLAQLGQSLDGRIATETGHAHYINGDDGLDHLHRLRALMDAVVIGAGTAVLDNPQLTTRRVEGPNPVRVVLDPHGRVPAELRCFDATTPSLRLIASHAPVMEADVRAIRLPAPRGVFATRDVLAALHQCGLRAILIEGGSTTVSRFLQEDALDRLHVLVAPLLIGSGTPGIRLPVIERLDEARRFRMTAHALGSDVLLDCRLRVDD